MTKELLIIGAGGIGQEVNLLVEEINKASGAEKGAVVVTEDMRTRIR